MFTRFDIYDIIKQCVIYRYFISGSVTSGLLMIFIKNNELCKMKKLFVLLLFTDLLFCATNYVWPGSPYPSSPYNSWETAAHSIQDAVNSATAGNLVLVTNGVYTGVGYSDSNTGESVVGNNKSITIKSVNGWAGTIIDGENTRRCLLSTNGVIYGFTLRNGFGEGPSGWFNPYKRFRFGGGALVKNGCVLSNCFIYNCSGENYGGGVCVNNSGYVFGCIISNCTAWAGGGACIFNYGTVTNCEIVKCAVRNGRYIDTDESPRGGGAAIEQGGLITDCLVHKNTALEEGGGISILETGRVSRCVITGNMSSNIGGGVYFINGIDALAQSCYITNNEATWTGGGVRFYNAGIVRNSLIADNYCISEGGGVYFRMQNAAYSGGNIESCTIVSNSVRSDQTGGGIYINGRGYATNSIVYYNLPDNIANTNSGIFAYCCASPLITGAGNMSAAPNFTNGYRLANDSPCVNAGINESWMFGAKDLAGVNRILLGTVDLGCYETIPETGIIFSFQFSVFGILFWRKFNRRMPG